MPWIIVAVVLTIWGTWVAQKPIVERLGYCWDPATLGQWGDTFGALNALFAAFGFAAVFMTLLLQQRQIRDAQNEQHRQRFESSYFELLRMLSDARQAIRFVHGKEVRLAKSYDLDEFEGRKAFLRIWIEFQTLVESAEITKKMEKEGLIFVYEIIHSRVESTLSPYYRLIYTILNRISKDRVLSNNEKVAYGNLLRSQLDSFEIAVIGLNAKTSFSGSLSKLVKEFRLLKYLPESMRRQELLKKLYDSEAFTGRDTQS